MKCFDYCTIIGRRPDILEAHANNVIENAGMPRGTWNFYCVVYANSTIASDTTDRILSICDDLDIIPHIYEEDENGPPKERFLKNLYACWNLCQTLGDSLYNVRAGSDQAFSKDAFANMWRHWRREPHKDKAVYFHNLVECRANTQQSRHILEDFGRDWANFDDAAFQAWSTRHSYDATVDHKTANALWGAPRDRPGLTSNGRADGASWIMAKSLFRNYGPMPPRYPNRLTGDIGLMNIMHDDKVRLRIIGDSHTYHFSRGESAPLYE